jgi:hypothetical protein
MISSPTFALITPGGSALGAFELGEHETEDGAVIRREGEPDRRVVGWLPSSEDPERFAVLVVERRSITTPP